jgi:hypothetical protein
MRINTKGILSAALFAALVTPLSLGLAGGGDKKPGGFWKALEPSVDREETVVVSLATDPGFESEPACVAVQIATNLLSSDLNGDDTGGEVTPADSVVLFLTLNGVELVAPDSDFSGTFCVTPGEDEALSTLLGRLVDKGAEVLVCPLCWKDRYPGQAPEFDAVVASPFDIHDLFLYADKILSF